jgi:hypothetical protein
MIGAAGLLPGWSPESPDAQRLLVSQARICASVPDTRRS